MLYQPTSNLEISCGPRSNTKHAKMHEIKLVINTREDLCNCLRPNGDTCRENTLILLNSAVIIPTQLQRLANLSPSGCGIRNHAAGAHDLGQIPAGNHRWGLIVDAALEAGRAPIHELNGALGLDRSNSCIHILWHHISLATNRPLPNKECGIRLGHENGKIFEAKRCHGKA